MVWTSIRPRSSLFQFSEPMQSSRPQTTPNKWDPAPGPWTRFFSSRGFSRTSWNINNRMKTSRCFRPKRLRFLQRNVFLIRHRHEPEVELVVFCLWVKTRCIQCVWRWSWGQPCFITEVLLLLLLLLSNNQPWAQTTGLSVSHPAPELKVHLIFKLTYQHFWKCRSRTSARFFVVVTLGPKLMLLFL